MNPAFLAAAALAFATGLMHSVFGERLIFRHLRRGTVVPTHGGDLLRQHQVRILWASWHVLTLLGWGLAAMLVVLASAPQDVLALSLSRLIAWAMGAGAMTVLVGTRGRHPGWVAMLLVAALVELGR